MLAYLRLMRPANIITAMADILAGFSLLFFPSVWMGEVPATTDWAWLLLATVGLYGGGVVFNDVFDAELDKVERPERPIPSGKATVVGAATLGALLLLIGVCAAFMVSGLSAIVALAVAFLAVLYDFWGKHQSFFGPVNMGMCRGGNLLLGMSAIPEAMQQFWWVAFIPILFISAVTMVSRGEVHGKNYLGLKAGFLLYFFVILSVLGLSVVAGYRYTSAIPFLAFFALLVFPPLIKAIRKPQPKLIGLAVKAGVISLIVMDAAIAAGFAGWRYGLLILVLLPISRGLAKVFAVT